MILDVTAGRMYVYTVGLMCCVEEILQGQVCGVGFIRFVILMFFNFYLLGLLHNKTMVKRHLP